MSQSRKTPRVEDAKLPTVTADFNGSPVSAPAGASVAAALITSEQVSWRTTREGRSRGLFCGIGVCFDCLVEIDGETGQRACMVPLEDGMDIRTCRTTNEHEATTKESGA